MERKRMQRAFHRLLTGLQIARNRSERMRFVTFTSAPIQKRRLKESFDILRKRIQRAKKYDKKGKIKDGFHGFKFNKYFCLRTSEGFGVLHVVFWGKFIPIQWLKRQWEDIHGAYQVFIEEITNMKKSKRAGGLVGYLITNYLTEQPIERMSYGWKWAWLGFCKSWKVVQENYGNLRRWRLPYKEGAKATWKDKFKDCSWEAWWTFLYGNRETTTGRLKMDKWVAEDEWKTDVTVRRLMRKWHIKEQKAIYGPPKKKNVWLFQSTLFGFNHGFA